MRISLPWQILAAMCLGALAGRVSYANAAAWGLELLPVYELLGDLFVNALKMLALPLVMASVISSVSALGADSALGRIGLKTLLFYAFTTSMAVLVAASLIGIVEPGLMAGRPAGARMALPAVSGGLGANLSDGAGGAVATLRRIVPPNLIEAAYKGDLPGLVLFSLLIGSSLTRIRSVHVQFLSSFFTGLSAAMVHATGVVMKLAPLGVFGLVAHTVTKSGFGAAVPLLLFSVTVLAGLLLYAVVCLPLLVRLVAGANPWTLLVAMAPALLTAFSTASSSAALATSLDCLKRRVGQSSEVGGFAMSLGVSLNHAGTALYECAAVLFIAQAYGMALSFAQRCMVAVMALATSMGMAGIPAASLVAIAAILSSLGLPAEALGVLLVFDRILDMCRTAVNVFADACCAVIVARLEGTRRPT